MPDPLAVGPDRLVELELTRPERRPVAHDDGWFGVVVRRDDRIGGFCLVDGAAARATPLIDLVDRSLGADLVELEIAARLRPPLDASTAPSVTVAICTRDRTERLARLLASLAALHRPAGWGHELEVVVVDNAPSDDGTRALVEATPGVRYVREPKPGLDFARNAAWREAGGAVVAYLDDDVTVDRWWLEGLLRVWVEQPDIGASTGLVLPMRLDTEARVTFERRGGFGRGGRPRRLVDASATNPLLAAASGIAGAGCNMALDRSLLDDLGGFDEALDTGRPLPGGGDLDIFYRVMRAGRPLGYEPTAAVFHEHRASVDELVHQYYTWGLGHSAYLVKSWSADPSNRRQIASLARWWVGHQIRAVVRTTVRWAPDRRDTLAELRGGVVGFLGEYGRSRRRTAAIRDGAP